MGHRLLTEDRLISFDFLEEDHTVHDLELGSIRELSEFVARHRFSRVMDLTDETLRRLFGESKPALVLFLESGGRVLDRFRKVTREYPHISAVFADLGSSGPGRAAEYLMDIVGLHRQDAPTLLYLPFTAPVGGVMPKYKTSRLTAKSMRSFIDSAQAGSLEIFKKSQPEPDDSSATRYTRVTLNNFDEKVLRAGRFFLLGVELFHHHTPLDLQDVFGRLAESVARLGLGDILEVGVCDLYRNEILEKVAITSLPHIMLFDRHDKARHTLYTGKLDVDDIREWLRSQIGPEVIESPERVPGSDSGSEPADGVNPGSEL